jgi:hypothetical protein
MSAASERKTEKGFYNLQNRKIHKARAQLGMGIDDCRELAREISGKPSISSLSPRQRWELIEELKVKGARVYNPPLCEAHLSSGGRPQNPSGNGVDGTLASLTGACSLKAGERPEDVYPERLAFWQEKFPRPRPGFASNEQLTWIEALWILDFSDGRPGRGLRGFIYRQTKSLDQGPVSDLAFLRSHHVKAIIGPLKKKAMQRQNESSQP